MDMKLSVIVPVYNVEPYLPACLDSLLAQTLKDLEILLVDDGSTDASGVIADRYAAEHPDIVRCLHVDNGGQGRARNFALPLARGEYLGFVDSDDWILPEMYERLCGLADETGADVAVCDFLERYDDGSERLAPAALQDHPLSFAGSCCNKVFRASLARGLRFPEGLWYEDFFFSAVMLMRSQRTEYLREPLYIYRRGQPSTMHNNNAAKNLDMLRIMEMLEKELDGPGAKKDFEFLVLNHVLLDTISRLARQDDPERKEIIRRFRDYVREKIPRLEQCESFRAETRNRRIIMKLNYMGQEDLGQWILRTKQKLR
ncbi:MAG: glycosyltransferase [Oscillospiraceae bacterium]|nr:glycosyltransferase [Oscillospiraceae bacterium]